jgi:hypothetical protein
LNIGFLPLPVDPISKAMTHPLRSTGITPLQHYKETDSPPQFDSVDAAMTWQQYQDRKSLKLKARFAELGGVPMPMTPADFGQFIVRETEKWAKVVKFSGAKPE